MTNQQKYQTKSDAWKGKAGSRPAAAALRLNASETRVFQEVNGVVSCLEANLGVLGASSKTTSSAPHNFCNHEVRRSISSRPRRPRRIIASPRWKFFDRNKRVGVVLLPRTTQRKYLATRLAVRQQLRVGRTGALLVPVLPLRPCCNSCRELER